jgi:hypothetical protein
VDLDRVGEVADRLRLVVIPRRAAGGAHSRHGGSIEIPDPLASRTTSPGWGELLG